MTSGQMTSRQRVLAAIEHRPVDRMPMDLGMHNSTGISAFAYRKLRRYLGLEDRIPEIIDMVQFLARVEEDVLERLHLDCIILAPRPKQVSVWRVRGGEKFLIPAAARPEQDERGNWIVRSGPYRMRMPAGGYFFDGDWLDIKGFGDEEALAETAKEARRIYEQTEYFTAYRSLYGFFKENNFDWQCSMLTEPELVIEEQERRLATEIERACKVIGLMGETVQAICVGADLGSQTSTLVRPSVYQELCAPYLKQLCDFIHRNSDFKIFYHCCGAIEPLVETLIDCGIDVLNPVQISASGMEPKLLKERYGDRITFWGGGCDTQNVLPFADNEKIHQHVTELCSTFAVGSGFVFNPVHNIMADVAPEKIAAVYEAAWEYGTSHRNA